MTTAFWCRILVVLYAAVCVLAGPAAAQPATGGPGTRVTGTVEDGTGRLRFDWGRPVGFEATLDNGRLVIHFDQPLNLDFDAATRVLDGYIGPPQRAADGRSVTVPLKRPVTLVFYDIDGVGFIDLVERSAEAEMPTPTPPHNSGDAQDTDSAGPAIGVRIGEHGKFSRIVFDWEKRVPYTVTRSGDALQVTFDRPANIGVARLKTPPAKHIRAATADSDASGSRVRLTVPADSRVEDMRVGPKVVLDVYARGTRTPPPPPPEAAGSQVEPDRPEAAAEAEPAEPKGAAPEPHPEEPRSPPLPDRTAEHQPKPAPEPPAIPQPTEDAPSAAHHVAPQDETKPDAAPAEPQDAAADAPITLRFPFKEPTPAAVFMRAGRIWAVFGTTEALDFDAVRVLAGSALADIDRLPVENATVLHMTPSSDIVPVRVVRDGSDWLLELGQHAATPEVPLEPRVEPETPDGGAIVIAVSEPAAPIAVTDPEVGDTVIVVPLYPVGHGLARGFEYPELDLLVSSQGLVIVPRIDDLIVNTVDGVEITSKRGLHLSPVPDDVRNRSRLAPDRALTRLTGLHHWRDLPLARLGAERRRLLRAAAAAEGGEREQPRVELAEFYLATGQAAESLGVLDVVAEDRPEIAEDARFLLLRGAAQVMMGRLAEAESNLAQPQLAGSDEAALWQVALAAARGRDADGRPVGAPDLHDIGALTLTYPRDLRTPLLFLLAESAIGRGEAMIARRFLDVLAMEDLGAGGEGRHRYLEGRLAQASGDFPQALAHWTEAEQGAHRASRARAALASIELRLDQGGMTPEQAIREAEKLRFAWRGDGFEFAYLRRLGELYHREGDDAASLRTLRQAVSSFPDHPDTVEITRQMADTFERLFLDGAAADVAPLSAIALFNEFRELNPAGDSGDQIIQSLADRLAAVDLLDQAADLLDDQVRHRLRDGVEKARTGARLALLRLLDRQPDAALEALQASEADEMPEPLQRQRRHLRARALAEMERFDEALGLLARDDGTDADLIRADIHWRMKDWRNAGRVLEQVATAAGANPGAALDDSQARLVLNEAVARSLADDADRLRQLDNDHGAAMDASPYRAAFRLVVADGRHRPAGLQAAVSDSVEDVVNFQAFLGAYRDRLQHEGLSTIN